jgi:coenzyme PQQ precursor peptide PqqA
MHEVQSKRMIQLTERPKPFSTIVKKIRNLILETTMTWNTPAAIDLRFGFEITMYIANR